MGTPAPSLPEVGSLIGGKYRVVRVLGEGGMGVVLEALHTRLDKPVAIKMLLPELLAVPELVGRFEREARAAGRLRHRNSARVIDVDVTETGLPYMVMELLHGHDLETELHGRGRLPVAEAVGYLTQACAAMAEAHGAGIVHRDLKPSNLFLSEEADGTVCVKVLDFGISKLQTADEARVTSTQTQMGTPLYMSPEQVRSAKNVDLRTDVWSLGVILHELLAGAPPFTGTPMAVAAAIVGDAPTPLLQVAPDVPEGVAAVVARAMEKDPSRRFASTTEMSAALAPFAAGPPAARPSLSLEARAALTASPSLVTAPTLAAMPAAAGALPRGPEVGTGGSWARSGETPARPQRGGLVAAGLVALGVLAAGGVLVAHLARAPSAPVASALPPDPSAGLAHVAAASASHDAVAPPTASAPAAPESAAVGSASPSATAPPRATGRATARPRATHAPSAAAPGPTGNPERL